MKKTNIWLLFLSILLLTACSIEVDNNVTSTTESSETEDSVPAIESSVDEGVVFEGELNVDTKVAASCVKSITDSFYESDLGKTFLADGTDNLYIIDTQEDFESISEYIPHDLGNSEDISSESILPEGFFEENTLIIVRFWRPYLGYDQEFLGATAEDGVVEISFSETEPRSGETIATAIMIRTFALALNKSEIDGYKQFSCSVTKLFAVNVEAAHNENKQPEVLPVEDSLVLYELINGLEWTEGQTDCLFDCDFESSKEHRYKYHSECGAVYDLYNEKTAVLSNEEKAVLERYLGITE